MYQRESWTTFSVHAYTYVKVELDYICMLAMQFDNLIIFLVLLNNEKMGGKCYILFPNHKIEILYAILGCFTNLSIEGKSRISNSIQGQFSKIEEV